MEAFFEPYKIKMVEPIRLSTQDERQAILRRSHFNPFAIRSRDVLIDLLTDSGTGAMSKYQWAEMMKGDEAYAGSESFDVFLEVIQDITGYKHVIPTHQGRAAEKLLFGLLGGKGKVIPSNGHFDTTRANIEVSGAEAVDLMIPEALKPEVLHPFKGNLNVNALKQLIESVGPDKIPLAMITVTNNVGGGQPVSIENIRAVKNVLSKHKIPLIIDACRFAENAYLIKTRSLSFANNTPYEIANEMFSIADGCTFSAKKDGLANIGGFLAFNQDEWLHSINEMLIMTEGYVTYGGLAGRDLAAVAQGLKEVLQEDYLKYRIASTAYLANGIQAQGAPVVQPPGGHAVYIDAKAMLPHIPSEAFPGQALVCALYEYGGIRSVEVGSLMFGKQDAKGNFVPSPLELVRLAIPRRVYTQRHFDYVIEVVGKVVKEKAKLRGFKITYETPSMRHFTAKLSEI